MTPEREIVLRRAEASDAPLMTLIHSQAFAQPWRSEDFESLLASGGVFGLLATADDGPLGVILCRVAAGEMEVLTLGVTPAARRGGVATMLMAETLATARAAGADACFLEVAVDNMAATGLYANLGFRPAGRRPRYYDRGPEGVVDALVMRLDLNAAST